MNAQRPPNISNSPIIDVIIPAYNEEKAIHLVVNEIPKDLVREIIVCNNGSTDQTSSAAKKAGATIVDEPISGYGRACLAGIQHIKNKGVEQAPDIVVFIDGDHSDYPEEMPNIIAPIIENDMDMVIGSRALGNLEPGSMMPQQIFGNWLATSLIKLFYGYSFTDLGPFRAIKWNQLEFMEMSDKTYGWTVEMQVKAAKHKFKTIDVPVNYRRRIGTSKVSGTVKGTILAGHKILWTIFKLL